MNTVSVNKFRDNLKTMVEHVVGDHVPLKVTRRSGAAFVVISADDWEREQESLYVMQNSDLMRQIALSLDSHSKAAGYKPNEAQIDAIISV